MLAEADPGAAEPAGPEFHAGERDGECHGRHHSGAPAAGRGAFPGKKGQDGAGAFISVVKMIGVGSSVTVFFTSRRPNTVKFQVSEADEAMAVI
jgi:hypothetical protein